MSKNRTGAGNLSPGSLTAEEETRASADAISSEDGMWRERYLAEQQLRQREIRRFADKVACLTAQLEELTSSMEEASKPSAYLVYRVKLDDAHNFAGYHEPELAFVEVYNGAKSEPLYTSPSVSFAKPTPKGPRP